MGALELKEEEIQKIKEWRQQGIMVLWTNGSGTKIYGHSDEPTSFNKKFNFSDSQLRELWKKAGVHVYVETDDVFYIGRNWMCIHTVIGGKRTIRFPFYTEVIDPLLQKVVADSTILLEINLDPKSTTIFRINPL
jgi:beta-galactosidase